MKLAFRFITNFVGFLSIMALFFLKILGMIDMSVKLFWLCCLGIIGLVIVFNVDEVK